MSHANQRRVYPQEAEVVLGRSNSDLQSAQPQNIVVVNQGPKPAIRRNQSSPQMARPVSSLPRALEALPSLGLGQRTASMESLVRAVTKDPSLLPLERKQREHNIALRTCLLGSTVGTFAQIASDLDVAAASMSRVQILAQEAQTNATLFRADIEGLASTLEYVTSAEFIPEIKL